MPWRRQRIALVGERDARLARALRRAGVRPVRVDPVAALAEGGDCDGIVFVDPLADALAPAERTVAAGKRILWHPAQRLTPDASPRHMAVSYLRFADRAIEIKRLLAAGALGPGVTFTARRSHVPPRSAARPGYWHAPHRGVITDLGADIVDLVGWWLGPLAVARSSHDGLGGPEAEAAFGLRGASAAGEVELSRLRRFRNVIDIRGNSGSIAFDLDSFVCTSEPASLLAGGAGRAASPADLHARRIAAWLASGDGDDRLQPSGTAGLVEDLYRHATRLTHPWEVDGECRFPTLHGRRVLVTGGTGFIGARVVERLAEERAVVTVAARNLRRAARVARCGVDPAAVGRAGAAALAAGHEIVINLAYDLSAPASANAAGVAALADACEAAGVERLVHVSSIAVYDGWPGEDLTEASPSDGPGHDYKMFKRAAERDLERRAAAGSLPTAMLQPTIVYGPFSRLWTDEFAERLQVGAVSLPEGGVCNGVYLDDVVDALLAAAASPGAAGRFITSGPQPFAWRQLIEGYAQVCGGIVSSETPATEAPARRRGLRKLLGDPLAIARMGWSRRLVGLVRARIGEERLDQVRRRLLERSRGGRPMVFRPADASPRLYNTRAAVSVAKISAELVAPRITLEEGLAHTQAYLRWRYGEDCGAADQD